MKRTVVFFISVLIATAAVYSQENSQASANMYDPIEKETLMYVCTKNMAPEMNIIDQTKSSAFCGCVVKGWEQEMGFAQVMLTFMKLGNEDIDESHPDSITLMKPMMSCGLEHKVFTQAGQEE